MPDQVMPGVYVEVIPGTRRSIEGVSTSVAGFVGPTERGPLRPQLVQSWHAFTRLFGERADPDVSFLPYAARGFFDNGGTSLVVARITRSDAQGAQQVQPTQTAGQQLLISAKDPGAFGDRILVRINPGSRGGVRFTVAYYSTVPNPFVDPTIARRNTIADEEPTLMEDYDNLDVMASQPEDFATVVNESSQLVHLAWSDAHLPAARPDDLAFTPLSGGSDGAAEMTAADFIGDTAVEPDTPTGLTALGNVDDLSIVSIPDAVNNALLPSNEVRALVQNALIDQCETLLDRMAILDVPRGSADTGEIHGPRDTRYAAIYYPWIRVEQSPGEGDLLVPPSGHVAGIYARSDATRGVHKSPANEVVKGLALMPANPEDAPLEFLVTARQQDVLNPRGINVIRDFRAEGRGIRVWGGRTLSSDPEWRYVSVRRLLIFLETSIKKGTDWVVFEPNGENLWAQLRESVRGFLTIVWRSGAFVGETPDQAFYVRCDRTTILQNDLDNGRVICEIGFAPIKPGEFVIFRFGHQLP